MPPSTRSNTRLAACFPFMKLPRELRDMVYDYSLSYDGIQKVILSDTYDKVGTSTAEDAGFLQTPVILLLDKETSSEAIECLRKKELIFTSPVRCGRALILDHVIPRRAFNNIRRIRFAMPEIQILKNYCDCVEQEDIFEEEEDDDEKEEKEQEEEKAKENRKTDIDLTTYLPLWVQLLEGLFKQFLGSASGSCMVGQIWLQVGAEVLVIRGETIFQLAEKALTIIESLCDSGNPDWLGTIKAILKKARSFHQQK